MTRSFRRSAHALLALGALAALLPMPAEAKDWEGSNARLVILDTWDWDPDDPAFRQYGIVKSARRVLEKLRSGQAPSGEGGAAQLAVWDAAKDQTLEQACRDEKVRGYLTQRFKSHGDLEVETLKLPVANDTKIQHPAMVLRTKGEGNNLRGKVGPCSGIMVVTLAKGKVLALRLLAWPATEHDEEGIVGDIDFMEANCLELLDVREDAKPPPPPPEGGDSPGGDPEKPGEEEEEEVIDDLAQGWRIVKHKRLKRVEAEGEDAVFSFADSDNNGGYQLIFYAIPHNKLIDGQQAAPPNLRNWMTVDWWKWFNPQHAKGEISSWKWPRKTERKTFITFPDLGDEEQKIVVFKDGQKRDPDPSPSDMEKWRCVETPKVDFIGPKEKASEAMRGILRGNRERYGTETVIRFAWRRRVHSYRLLVTVYGLAHQKWGEALRSTLESLEFTK